MKLLVKKVGAKVTPLVVLEFAWMYLIASLYVGSYGIKHLLYAVSIWIRGQRLDTAMEIVPMFVLVTGMILCIAILWVFLEQKVLHSDQLHI